MNLELEDKRDEAITVLNDLLALEKANEAMIHATADDVSELDEATAARRRAVLALAALMGRPEPAPALFEPPEQPLDEDGAIFQGQATMADAGVAAILARCQQTGADPRAIAAGALFSVVRYHMDFLGVARAERAIVRVMLPSISKAVHVLLRDEREQARELRKLD